jgi:curli biogenesis system outer membrane secretion channel CsgG
MKTATIHSAMTVMLAAAAGVLASISLSLQVRTVTAGESVISQYCAPPADSIDVHTFYCRMDG